MPTGFFRQAGLINSGDRKVMPTCGRKVFQTNILTNDTRGMFRLEAVTFQLPVPTSASL